METVIRLHANLLFTILLVFSSLMLWALIAALLRRPLGQLFHSGMTIGFLLVLSQCILGVIMLLRGLLPLRPELHILYAIIALVTVPVAHSSAREREPRAQALVYATACLFLCVIVLRDVAMARP